MNQVLLINASAQGAASHANRLALDLVACLRQAHPALALVERPVGTDPLPALSQAYVQALTTATPFDAPELALSEMLIRELEQSDALLIATPLHNFTLPAALKLWIDYVLRIHRTFQSSAEGKLGLLADRPVYVLVGSGGFHQGPRTGQPDFLTPYLRHALNTLGLFNIHFFYLQGLVFGDEAVRQTIDTNRALLAQQPLFSRLADPHHLGVLP
ncbi:FMN-dependent NADH-azoreductase [Aeromonas dhakensis]|uniref:FMN-dependent NADH-azoreductase n=1 Tax=Aeromonas dhakensis TaxID=196024 RepID=UPI003987B4D7